MGCGGSKSASALKVNAAGAPLAATSSATTKDATKAVGASPRVVGLPATEPSASAVVTSVKQPETTAETLVPAPLSPEKQQLINNLLGLGGPDKNSTFAAAADSAVAAHDGPPAQLPGPTPAVVTHNPLGEEIQQTYPAVNEQASTSGDGASQEHGNRSILLTARSLNRSFGMKVRTDEDQRTSADGDGMPTSSSQQHTGDGSEVQASDGSVVNRAMLANRSLNRSFGIKVRADEGGGDSTSVDSAPAAATPIGPALPQHGEGEVQVSEPSLAPNRNILLTARSLNRSFGIKVRSDTDDRESGDGGSLVGPLPHHGEGGVQFSEPSLAPGPSPYQEAYARAESKALGKPVLISERSQHNIKPGRVSFGGSLAQAKAQADDLQCTPDLAGFTSIGTQEQLVDSTGAAAVPSIVSQAG